MLLPRFIEELERAIPLSERPFRREGQPDKRVLSAPLPPYRHIFHGLCLIEHSRGYRLPRYRQFKTVYLGALQHHHRYKEACSWLFVDGEPHPGLLNRIGGWYLDGLAHTQLYCALVQAYEEQRRIGAVLMDARVDVKLKTDIVIVSPHALARVDIRHGTGLRQADLLRSRAAAERSAKANNSSSSQSGNPVHETIQTATIARSESGAFRDSGVELFTAGAIDKLLGELDALLGVSNDAQLSYDEMCSVTMRKLEAFQSKNAIRRL